MYSVFVYATNQKGRGVDSNEMNISTHAVGEFSSLSDNFGRASFEPHVIHMHTVPLYYFMYFF